MIDIDGFLSAMSAKHQLERAETQMTLGDLIAALEAMTPDAEVANLRGPHSYRGYYSDLAFEICDGLRPAKDLLSQCKAAMGRAFVGYKGGDYVMGKVTPIWISEFGSASGTKLMAIRPGGEIETEQEEW